MTCILKHCRDYLTGNSCWQYLSFQLNRRHLNYWCVFHFDIKEKYFRLSTICNWILFIQHYRQLSKLSAMVIRQQTLQLINCYRDTHYRNASIVRCIVTPLFGYPILAPTPSFISDLYGSAQEQMSVGYQGLLSNQQGWGRTCHCILTFQYKLHMYKYNER